jgi:hypothetical protein
MNKKPPRKTKIENGTHSDELADDKCITFRLTIADVKGTLARVSQRFVAQSLDIIEAQIKSISDLRAAYKFIIVDNTQSCGFQPLLHICRNLQSLESCNHLLAQFGRIHAKKENCTPGAPIEFDSNLLPLFESFYSGQVINSKEALHPENTDGKQMNHAFYELDKAATEFIRDPEKIFFVSPKDLERVVAEIYRAHGFDVKITGGPHDHGIDVIATALVPASLPPRLGHHMKIGIQVKRYKSGRKVREKQVRDLYGALAADSFDRGVLISTSSLTASAQAYLDSRRAVQDRISVIAGDEILELIVSYCRQKWIPFWK